MINLTWSETEEGWFVSFPIGKGRTVEISVVDDVVVFNEGSLGVDYMVEGEDPRRFAERVVESFVEFANAVSRAQWAASNLKKGGLQ